MIAARVGRGELLEPVPRVLVIAGAPMTYRCRVSVATLAGGGTVASHRAAAWLHGIDGFTLSAPVEVTVRRGRYPAIDAVVVHRAKRVEAADIVVVDGLPVTSVARTLCDLGAVVHQDLVEQALDWALRRGFDERWIRDVLDRVDRPGPSGTATLRRVLDDPRRAGRIPQTWFERLVKRVLAAPDLPQLELQHEVRDPQTGTLVAVLDGCFVPLRIGIEAHSAEWHDRPGRVWRDMERDNRLKALGYDIVYVTYGLARRPAQVLETVRAIRRQRALAADGSNSLPAAAS